MISTSTAPDRRRAGLALALVAVFLTACSDSSDRSPTPPPEVVPFQELYDQGILRYLGEYTPMSSEDDGRIIQHTFGTGDGPQCLDGGEYTMATRDAGSENLVIFLQGGGACWSEFCSATREAAPGIPEIGLLDQGRGNNPVADWNLAYFPYCDGGLFASDNDRDEDGDGTNELTQRGLHNLSAGLDVTANTFPAPQRILLVGASAGGLGTTFALPVVRSLYPDIPIDVVNDSGIGVGRPDQPEFQELLLSDWNSQAFFPESCDQCIADDGHLTDYHSWQMNEDPNTRRGFLSYDQDTVFADIFLMIGKPAFEEAMREEMQQAEDDVPDRVRTWIPTGTGHTFVQSEPDQTAGGVGVLDWIGFMINESDDWVSVAD